jgi:hypothetical protein
MANGAFVSEDPRVAALRQGMSILRADWALVEGYVAGRVARTREGKK